VRDVLHVDDLYDLMVQQLGSIDRHRGRVYNVGGGIRCSVSLRELTALCRQISQRHLPIGCIPETTAADIPFYVADCSAITEVTGWRPRRSLQQILDDIWRWLLDNRAELGPILSR
jgi:CDP-paratose 2-epimerase